MVVHNGPPGTANHVIQVAVAVLAVHLVHHDQAFLAIHFDREGCSCAGRQCRVRAAHAQFDIVGIQVASPHDNHLLLAAGDKQISVVQETQVARPQIGFLAFALDRRLEVKAGVLRPAPIPFRHAGSSHPDLADLMFG